MGNAWLFIVWGAWFKFCICNMGGIFPGYLGPTLEITWGGDIPGGKLYIGGWLLATSTGDFPEASPEIIYWLMISLGNTFWLITLGFD